MRHKRSLRWYGFDCCLLLVLAGVPAQGTGLCPNPLGPPYWIWYYLYYVNQSTLPYGAAGNAASGWNRVEGSMLLQPAGPFNDIIIHDGTLPAGRLGRAIVYSQGSGSCYYQKDACGNCMTENVAYQADVTVDVAQVQSAASRNNFDLTTMATEVLSHELGHVLSLDNVPPVGGDCPEISSVMYDSAVDAVRCSVITATSVCDGPAVTFVYGDTPGPYCSCTTESCAP